MRLSLPLLCTFPLLAMAQTSAILDSPVAFADGIFIDWTYDPAAPNVCHGYYAPPVFDAQLPPEQTLIQADESFLSQNDTSILTGDVRIIESNQHVFAEQAFLYRNAQGDIDKIEVPGQAMLEQPGWRAAGCDVVIILENDQTTAHNVQYRFYDRAARGSAQRIEYAEGTPTELFKANYTTCQPDCAFWQLQASKVSLDEEAGRGESFNTVVKVHNIPIFYTPYFNFPIDNRRKTGFLQPEFSISSQSGFKVGTPLYLNLAPNYDATLYPVYMSDRGMQWGADLRYMDSYHETFFHADYLDHDQKFVDFRNDELANPPYPADDPRLTGLEDAGAERWQINFRHRGEYDPHWDVLLDYNQVSDDNYYQDLGNQLFDRQDRQLLQRAQVNYLDRHFAATALVQDYQVLQPFDKEINSEPYQVLPHLELDIMPDTTFAHSQIAINSQWTYFDHGPCPSNQQTPTVGSRAHVDPILSMPMRRPYGYLTPAVELRYTQYDLSLSDSDQMLDKNSEIYRTIPSFFVDGGLFFDRNTTFMNKSYLHTLEPRVMYLYTPNEDQNDIPLFDTGLYDFTTDQLFRTNRFTGIDRIGDANQVSAGVTTRFYEDSTGIERFTATVGQIYYFEDRRVSLCDTSVDPYCWMDEDPNAEDSSSPLVGDLRYRFNPNWYSTMNARYDTRRRDSDRYRLILHYQPQQDRIAHFGFNYEENGNNVPSAETNSDLARLLQTDTGVIWPVGVHWSVLGRWYYDIQNHYTVEAFGGLEYESCCWALRFGVRHYLRGSNEILEDREYDQQMFFQFIFKGLTDLGRSPVSLLADGIPGYTDRLDEYY